MIDDDASWKAQREYGEEFYGDFARFADGNAHAGDLTDVDLLLIDDIDSGAGVADVLVHWQPKLASTAVVLLHGHRLERDDPPARAWASWSAGKQRVEFADGIGLAVAALGPVPAAVATLFDSKQRDTAAILYHLAAARIEASARTEAAERDNAVLRTRQIWLDSILNHGWHAQAVMDNQLKTLADLEQRFANLTVDRDQAQQIIEEQLEQISALRRDRAKAQIVMDAQHEQLQHWVGLNDRLKSELKNVTRELKARQKIIKAAQEACRRGGKCFHVSSGPKVRRSLGERLVRELQRWPRNLGIVKPPPPPPSAKPAHKRSRHPRPQIRTPRGSRSTNRIRQRSRRNVRQRSSCRIARS